MKTRLAGWTVRMAACCAMLGVGAGPAWAIVPRRGEPTGLQRKQFAVPELSFGSRNAPLAEVQERLPNRAAWEAARAESPDAARIAFIDPRSGAATNIQHSSPLIPGDGTGNRMSLGDLGRRIGRPVDTVDAAVVAEAALLHVRESQELLGIDATQLGRATATRITPHLWRISIPQEYRGVPVRHARVSATVSHGNLASKGAHTWGNVALDPTPRVSAEDALAAGFRYAEGRLPDDDVSLPKLEILPTAPPEHQTGARFTGPVGAGYGHRLVWTFEFTRPPDLARWEVTVDAHTGEVIAFGDVNHYASRKRPISGGVYPHTSTGTCPDVSTCGVMQDRTPMPFADFAEYPDPNRFANSAGVYDYVGGTTATRLLGARAYLDTHASACSGGTYPPVHGSSNGVLSLGGTNGQHDCDAASAEPWNTASARTIYYEVNKINEMAVGYLPERLDLLGRPAGYATVSFGVNGSEAPCNAAYDLAHRRIYTMRAAEGCRNTGEIVDVPLHEWGHFLDHGDATGRIDSTGEGYADIASLYRTQQSCLGTGFFETNDEGCGMSPDGTGANTNEAAPEGSYCTTVCSGVRDADWVRHAPAVPADPLGFVCTQCGDAAFGFGPCGKKVHCGATPIAQAAWDLVARDLVAAPYALDSQTAFIVGNKLFYQGSANVGEWFKCECGGTADGCHEDSGYMHWLQADDDNDTLEDGTPHMTAISNAFARHGIACPTPLVRDGGCVGRPTAVANVTATPRAYGVALQWTAVPDASRYWVFRTEGHAGCNYGKALIAEVEGLSYTDGEVAAGRPYYYNVMAVGSHSSCFGPASPCVSAVPGTGNVTLACTPDALVLPGGPVSTTCSVKASGGFGGEMQLGCAGLPAGTACLFDPATVNVGVDGTATSQLRVQLGLQPPPASSTFKVRATPPVTFGAVHETSVALNVGAAGELFAQYDPELRVPSCGTVGRSCDTGPALIRFRDNRGPEPNQPNVLGGPCPDGTATAAGGNGSNDRIRIATVDGTPLAAGKAVVLTATVQTRAAFAQDEAAFFFAADVGNPSWQHIDTIAPTAGGTQTITTRYVLPAGSRQAVRVVYRRQGTPACTASSLNDSDDLVFAVGNP